MSKCFESKKLSDQELFNQDLCRALVTSNIPLSKLNNQNFLSFITKCRKVSIPSERSLRRNDVESLYINICTRIREAVGNNNFFNKCRRNHRLFRPIYRPFNDWYS